MKAFKSPIPWLVLGVIVLASAGFLVFRYANPFGKPEPSPVQQSNIPAQPAVTSNLGTASDCCGLPIWPLEEDYFDQRLPDHLKPLAHGPWPGWVRVEENELIFVTTGVKVPYANKKYAVMHREDDMDPKVHTSLVDLPLLIPGGRGMALLQIRFYYEGSYMRLIVYDRKGQKTADFEEYPWFPRFSPNGEFILGYIVDIESDYIKNEAMWLARVDGSTQFVTWASDLNQYLNSHSGTGYGDVFSEEVLFTPDSRHCVAFMGERAVILNLHGIPIGVISVKLKPGGTPANPQAFWKAVNDCIARGAARPAGPDPESKASTTESKPAIPGFVPDRIRELITQPLPPSIRMTGTEIAFTESGVTVPYSGEKVNDQWEEPSTELPFCLPNGKGLVLMEIGLNTRRMDLSLYDTGGQLLSRVSELGDWPHISPDGERILVFKYREPSPRAAWIIRSNGEIEAMLWWDDIVRYTGEPGEHWWGLRGLVLPSRDWKHLFAFIDWGDEKGWRVAILSPEGEFRGKMPIGTGVVEVDQGELRVSEEALQAIEECAANLKE